MTRTFIVDGVDVSGCPEYCKYRDGYCGWHVPCDVEGSCQYKINWLKQQLSLFKNSHKTEQDRRRKFENALEEIKTIADKFDYWSNNLTDASNVINEIKDKIDEVMLDGNNGRL